MAGVNYLLRPFEGNIIHVDTMGIKIYSQETKEIGKETNKLDISFSNAKDTINHFLSISNKYVCVRLAFMVRTDIVAKNIFRVVEKIQIADVKKST